MVTADARIVLAKVVIEFVLRFLLWALSRLTRQVTFLFGFWKVSLLISIFPSISRGVMEIQGFPVMFSTSIEESLEFSGYKGKCLHQYHQGSLWYMGVHLSGLYQKSKMAIHRSDLHPLPWGGIPEKFLEQSWARRSQYFPGTYINNGTYRAGVGVSFSIVIHIPWTLTPPSPICHWASVIGKGSKRFLTSSYSHNRGARVHFWGLQQVDYPTVG